MGCEGVRANIQDEMVLIRPDKFPILVIPGGLLQRNLQSLPNLKAEHELSLCLNC